MCSALQSQSWCWEQLVAAGSSLLWQEELPGTLGLSPHGVCLCSWGPDDDGKTVDGPHQLGKVKRSPSSPKGEPPGLVAFCLPIQAGRDVAVTLCSLCVSLGAPVPVWVGEVALWREGSAQAGQERLVPAGKGSFTTCGVALTA